MHTRMYQETRYDAFSGVTRVMIDCADSESRQEYLLYRPTDSILICFCLDLASVLSVMKWDDTISSLVWTFLNCLVGSSRIRC